MWKSIREAQPNMVPSNGGIVRAPKTISKSLRSSPEDTINGDNRLPNMMPTELHSENEVVNKFDSC